MDAERIAAEVYVCTVPDWPDEIKFYEGMASPARSLLEIACGTGRVSLRLAGADRHIFCFDASPHMIENREGEMDKASPMLSLAWRT